MEIITSSSQAIALEEKYGAHNYHPLPVVLTRGEGVFVWDVEGKRYYDFLSAYSAVNQGHCHPRIKDAMIEQLGTLTLTSRAFHNDQLGPFEQYITQYFGFDKVLPMNTGAEGVETALKLARKWGHEVKGVAENEAKIIVAEGNFHGRTTTIVSFSTDEQARKSFGPFTPGFITIPYDDIAALEQALEQEGVVGFLIEPIQGEAGVYKGHCEQQATYVQPDILILGKALSGGFYPVSAVLANDAIMNVLKPGQHGSTFGGNPVAARVAMTALEVVRDEKLAQNARVLGDLFRSRMQVLVDKYHVLSLVRGKGLLNAVVINDSPESSTAWDICVKLAEAGLLAKPTHGNIIRFAPPLVMTEDQLHECVDIIESVVATYG